LRRIARALLTLVAWFAIAAFASPCAQAQARDSNQTIVAGQRMGNVYVGMSVAALLRTLGEPAQRVGSARPSYIWTYPGGEIVVAVANDRVWTAGIGWTSGYTGAQPYATARGLTVGASRLDVDALLGTPNAVWSGRQSTILCYDSGIAVGYFTSGQWSGTVFQIMVFHPLAIKSVNACANVWR
jgi:hypothetical protein